MHGKKVKYSERQSRAGLHLEIQNLKAVIGHQLKFISYVNACVLLYFKSAFCLINDLFIKRTARLYFGNFGARVPVYGTVSMIMIKCLLNFVVIEVIAQCLLSLYIYRPFVALPPLDFYTTTSLILDRKNFRL